MDKSTISKHSRQFLADAQKGGRVFNVSDDLPKTYVVCVDREGTETVYISQISSATLRRRAEFIKSLSNILPEKQGSFR